MSGTATAQWAFHSRRDIRNSSMRVAKLLGCDNGTGEAYVEPGSADAGIDASLGADQNVTKEIDARIVECMKKANATDVVSKGYFVSKPWPNFHGSQLILL